MSEETGVKVCVICKRHLPLKVFRRMRLGKVTYNNKCNSCRNRLYRERRERREEIGKPSEPKYTTPWPCTYPGCGLYLSSKKALREHFTIFHEPYEEREYFD